MSNKVKVVEIATFDGGKVRTRGAVSEVTESEARDMIASGSYRLEAGEQLATPTIKATSSAKSKTKSEKITPEKDKREDNGKDSA